MKNAAPTPEVPSGLPDALRRQLMKARRSLWIARLLRAFWPLWCLGAVAASLWLLGVFETAAAKLGALDRDRTRLRGGSCGGRRRAPIEGADPGPKLCAALITGWRIAPRRCSTKTSPSARARAIRRECGAPIASGLAREAEAARAPAADLRLSSYDRWGLRYAALFVLGISFAYSRIGGADRIARNFRPVAGGGRGRCPDSGAGGVGVPATLYRRRAGLSLGTQRRGDLGADRFRVDPARERRDRSAVADRRGSGVFRRCDRYLWADAHPEGEYRSRREIPGRAARRLVTDPDPRCRARDRPRRGPGADGDARARIRLHRDRRLRRHRRPGRDPAGPVRRSQPARRDRPADRNDPDAAGSARGRGHGTDRRAGFHRASVGGVAGGHDPLCRGMRRGRPPNPRRRRSSCPRGSSPNRWRKR